MRLILAFICPLLLEMCSAGNKNIPFIMDFFGTKADKISLFACWKQEYYKELITHNNKLQQPKQIASFTLNQFHADAIIATSDVHNNYIVLDANCPQSSYFLNQLNENDQYKSPMKMLIITDEINYSTLYQKVIKYKMYFNSDVIIATYSNQTYRLVQVYKIAENSPTNFIPIGEWDKNGYKKYTNSLKCNFEANKFDVAMVLEDQHSLQHLEDFRFPWRDIYTKQNYGVLTRLFDYCNITYSFKRVTDYSHIFNGVGNQTFLLTGSSPYLTKDLLKKMDVMYVQNAPKICFIMKRPPTSYVTTIFTDAFSAYVWYAMLVTLALLAVAMFIILNIEGHREKIKFQEKFTVFDLGLIALEAICQQGTSTDPKSYSGRILAVIMFTAFMFLYVSYSANILVLLQSTTNIKNDELYKFRFKYGGMNTSAFQQYHSDIGANIFRDSIRTKDTCSIEDGMELVRDGLFAFFSESSYVYNYAKDNFTDYEICGLQEVSGYYEKNLGYISIMKNSPYKEILKVSLLRMVEYGFQSRHYNRYFLKPRCFSKGTSFDPVGMVETYQVMILVVLGTIFSMFVFVLEKALFKMRERNNQ